MKAWEFVEKGWCQGKLATDADEQSVAPEDPKAASWCLVGAIVAAYGDYTVTSLHSAMAVYKHTLITYNTNPVDYNNMPGRTQAEVVALLKELDV